MSSIRLFLLAFLAIPAVGGRDGAQGLDFPAWYGGESDLQQELTEDGSINEFFLLSAAYSPA